MLIDAYLAQFSSTWPSPGTLVSREQLLNLFWEDIPPTKARGNLRGALSRIRSEIPNSDLLIHHNDLVGLDAESISVDQQDFIAYHDSFGNKPWIIPADETIPGKIFQPMLRTANLWHGSQFMEGIDLPDTRSLDSWWQQTNLHLTNLRSRLCSRSVIISGLLVNSKKRLHSLALPWKMIT